MKLTFDVEDVRPLVEAAVEEALRRVQQAQDALPEGQMAYHEKEAAPLLGMKWYQLRDERRRGKIRGFKGPGGKVYYSKQDLLAYVAHNRDGEGAGK